MSKASALRIVFAKKARSDLIRGLASDLSEWGLKGNLEQITTILLRFEKYQEDMGETPTYKFRRGE